MTMLIYIVSFQHPNANMNMVVGGVWGAYTSLEKARHQIECWIEDYEEELQDYNELDNGLHVYITNRGKWIIEPMCLDD